MEDERRDLQVQAGMACDEKRVLLQPAMKDAEMESDGCSGQFGCRTEEGRSEMEVRDRWKMGESEWMEGSDELEPMEDNSCCVPGTEVEGPDRA
jgi:hypothetical protein